MKQPKKSTLLLKSLLFLFVSWLAGFFIIVFFPMCYYRFGAIMCLVFGFCSAGAAMCIYGDFCYKAGAKMNTKSARMMNDVKTDRNFGAIIGLVPTVINYIYVLILWLSKLGAMKLDFFPWYKTLTFYFMPLSYIVAPNIKYVDENGSAALRSVPASDLTIGAMIIFTLLPILFELTCWAAYYVGYEHINLKDKILYGGRTKE